MLLKLALLLVLLILLAIVGILLFLTISIRVAFFITLPSLVLTYFASHYIVKLSEGVIVTDKVVPTSLKDIWNLSTIEMTSNIFIYFIFIVSMLLFGVIVDKVIKYFDETPPETPVPTEPLVETEQTEK